jgi:gamma-glutamyl-gamma-aminobutyrate hydrolase PuuD
MTNNETSTTEDDTPRWSRVDLPYFEDRPKVFIPVGGQFALIVRMFAEIGFTKANTLEEANLVVYSGGSDVSPEFYGQSPIDKCGIPDRKRDEAERKIFLRARELDIPQVGICRGAQFLHVMCGGTLWQHVNNHTRDHLMYDLMANVMVRTSSTHHQMMRYNDKMTLIACCDDDVATYYEDAFEVIDHKKDKKYRPQLEVEVCSYDDEKVLCIQGHPEFGPREFTSWSLHLLKDWLNAVKKEKAECVVL